MCSSNSQTKNIRRMGAMNRKRTVSFNWHFIECEISKLTEIIESEVNVKFCGSLILTRVNICILQMHICLHCED